MRVNRSSECTCLIGYRFTSYVIAEGKQLLFESGIVLVLAPWMDLLFKRDEVADHQHFKLYGAFFFLSFYFYRARRLCLMSVEKLPCPLP